MVAVNPMERLEYDQILDCFGQAITVALQKFDNANAILISDYSVGTLSKPDYERAV